MPEGNNAAAAAQAIEAHTEEASVLISSAASQINALVPMMRHHAVQMLHGKSEEQPGHEAALDCLLRRIEHLSGCIMEMAEGDVSEILRDGVTCELWP